MTSFRTWQQVDEIPHPGGKQKVRLWSQFSQRLTLDSGYSCLSTALSVSVTYGGGTGGVSPQPPLHQMISYLHEFLQRHEISQRHLLATKEGPVFQEHVLQLPQKSIHTGPVAFHLGLNGCCSHLMVAEDGFSLYLHLFLGP